MNGLWRGHKRRNGTTQRSILIQMLREARAKGGAVLLPEIMAAGIAQHGARFNEIRAHRFVIENELDRDNIGVVHSRYWLKYDPEQERTDGK